MKITFQRLNYTTLYFLDFIKLRTILDNQHLYKKYLKCTLKFHDPINLQYSTVLSIFFLTIRKMGIYSEDLYTIRHSALFYFCIG